MAAFGAVLSAMGETSHAVLHMELNAHAGAVAGSLSPLGRILVVGALWRLGARERRARAGGGGQHRTA